MNGYKSKVLKTESVGSGNLGGLPSNFPTRDGIEMVLSRMDHDPTNGKGEISMYFIDLCVSNKAGQPDDPYLQIDVAYNLAEAKDKFIRWLWKHLK